MLNWKISHRELLLKRLACKGDFLISSLNSLYSQYLIKILSKIINICSKKLIILLKIKITIKIQKHYHNDKMEYIEDFTGYAFYLEILKIN